MLLSHVYTLSRFSRVRLSVTPWTVARHAPPSMEFSRQEYWSGLPFPPPGDRPDPGIEPMSLVPPALAGRFFTTSAIWEALLLLQKVLLSLHSWSHGERELQKRSYARPFGQTNNSSPEITREA